MVRRAYTYERMALGLGYGMEIINRWIETESPDSMTPDLKRDTEFIEKLLRNTANERNREYDTTRTSD